MGSLNRKGQMLKTISAPGMQYQALTTNQSITITPTANQYILLAHLDSHTASYTTVKIGDETIIDNKRLVNVDTQSNVVGNFCIAANGHYNAAVRAALPPLRGEKGKAITIICHSPANYYYNYQILEDA